MGPSHLADFAVSLGWLLEFTRTCPDALTTAQVVQQLIQPATGGSQKCRYSALPGVRRGRSTYCVSHRWGQDFGRELVAATVGHFIDQADAEEACARQRAQATAAGTGTLGPRCLSLTGPGTGPVSPSGATAPDSTVASPGSIAASLITSSAHLSPNGPPQGHALDLSPRVSARHPPSTPTGAPHAHPPHAFHISDADPPLLPHAGRDSFRLSPSVRQRPCFGAPAPAGRFSWTSGHSASRRSGPGGDADATAETALPLPGTAQDSPRSPRSPTRTGSASRGGSGSGAGSSFLNPLQASRPPVPGPGAADGPPPSLDPAACLGPSDRALGRINLSQRASGSFTGRPPMPPSTLPPSALLGSGSHLGLVLGFGSSAAAGRHGGPEGSGGGATAAVAAGTLMNLPSVTATSACCAASAPSTTSASSGAISGGGSLTSRSWDAAAAAPATGATARPPPLGTLSESSGAATAPPGSLRRSSAVVGAAAAAALAAADAALAAAAAGAGKGAGAGGGGGRCTGNAALAASLLAALAGRPELLEGTYVWIDIFAVNQHPGKTQADDLARLQEVVGASEGTLLVLDPAGLVLTRIWCLYEIWQTVRRWGPKGLRVLSGTLRRDELAAVWAELDVERAQATLESDRTRILADIRATTGGNELNHHIKRALVESAVAELAEARAAAPRSPRHGAAALKAAALLRTSSASGSAASEALAAAREAAEVLRECGGPTHGDTLEALRAVAGCHSDAGALGLALGLLQQQVLPHLEEAYGPGHVSYDAWYDVGCLQYKMGLYVAAYSSLLTALVHQLRALAAAAPPTAAPTQDLAAVVAGADGNVVAMSTAVAAPPPLRWDQLAAALAAMRALAAAAREEAAEVAGSAGGAGCALAGSGAGGPLHRSAARAADRVGLTLNMLGLVQVQRARSLPASSGSLTASTSAPSGFSPAGPGLDPAPSRHGLLREARLLMEASVELLEVFGCAGRGVAALDARSNLAGVAMEAGELQSAERLFRANLSLTEAVYGPRHRHTATALNNLAVCLKRQRQRVSDGPDCAGGGPDGSGLLGGGGRRSSSSLGTGGDPRAAEAAALYRRCLALCEGALGEAHPETLVVATNLGVLLAEQHCWTESERLLTRAVAGLPLQAGEGQPNPDALLAHRRLAEVLELRGRLFEAEALYRTALQYAESACPEARDHCLILDCREALGRVGERLEELARRAQNQDACCIVS